MVGSQGVKHHSKAANGPFGLQVKQPPLGNENIVKKKNIHVMWLPVKKQLLEKLILVL